MKHILTLTLTLAITMAACSPPPDAGEVIEQTFDYAERQCEHLEGGYNQRHYAKCVQENLP